MQQQHPANKHTRRQMGRLALGGLTAVALAACGGGGGDDSSDSGNQRSLLDVFNKLEDGMGQEEVTALAGRTANQIGGTGYNWSNNAELLLTDFNYARGTQISGASWSGNGNQQRSKQFKEV